MNLTITTKVLIMIIIIAVELVVITVVISCFLWRRFRKSNKKSSDATGNVYHDKASASDDEYDSDIRSDENKENKAKSIPSSRRNSKSDLSVDNGDADDDKGGEKIVEPVSCSDNLLEHENEIQPQEKTQTSQEISDLPELEKDICKDNVEAAEENVKAAEEITQKCNIDSTPEATSISLKTSAEASETPKPTNEELIKQNDISQEADVVHEEKPKRAKRKKKNQKNKKNVVESKPLSEVTVASEDVQTSQSPKPVKIIDPEGITLSLRIDNGGSLASPTVFVNGRVLNTFTSSKTENNVDFSPSDKNEVVQVNLAEKPSTSMLSQASFKENEDLEIGKFVGEEETVAGIINVTTGEKLTVCQAKQRHLIPEKTALFLLEAQAATGSVVNPRNGVRLSVSDAVTLGIIDEEYKQCLIEAEGACYGFVDPRTRENICLGTAIIRGIFPRLQGVRLLETQIATGGIIDPWSGLRYPLKSALSKYLIDPKTAETLQNPKEQTELFDPITKTKLGYDILLGKCIRDLDTGLKFLYVEENPTINSNRIIYEPNLLTFRNAFRTKVTLQELINAKLVPQPTLDAFRSGQINNTVLQNNLRPILLGEEPIGGVINKANNKVLNLCQAIKEGALKRGTALELLEAQVATGSIIDPVSGKKMSVNRAISIGLVDSAYTLSLKKVEKAVRSHLVSDENPTMFEAMSKKVVIESQWIRMLEAQLATGGVIDPKDGYRMSMEAALNRGLIDQKVADIIAGTDYDMKGYTDPVTGDNITYEELMDRCVRHKKKYGNLLLLPIKGEVTVTDTRYSENGKPSKSKLIMF